MAELSTWPHQLKQKYPTTRAVEPRSARIYILQENRRAIDPMEPLHLVDEYVGNITLSYLDSMRMTSIGALLSRIARPRV